MARASYVGSARHGAWRAANGLVLHRHLAGFCSAVDTLMARLAGKTAAETVAAMMATFRWLDPGMRGSVIPKEL